MKFSERLGKSLDNVLTGMDIYIYIQGDSRGICNTLGNDIVCVILSKKVHMNIGPILNGYRDMVKRKYGPSCEHEQQLRNKKHHN
jgi:uncharacterized membrane-anchored protein YitT (DUF2179 family)